MTKKFALLLPTARTDRHAYGIINYLGSIAHDDLHIYISDNSEDPHKGDFLRDLSKKNPNIISLINEKNIGSYASWLNLVNITQDYTYSCGASDKNYISESWLNESITVLESRSDVSTACGHYLSLTSNGSIIPETVECLEESPIERIKKYFGPGWNANIIVYTPHRVKDNQPYLNFCKSHPLLALFVDHFQGYGLLAKGKFLRHKKGLCTWDSSGWDNVEGNWNSQINYYKHTGLPETFVGLNWLYCAVDSVHFCLGEHSPHASHQEASEAATFLWHARRQNFILRYEQNPDFYKLQVLSESSDALKCFESLLYDNNNAEDLINQFSNLLNHFNPAKAEHYREHVLTSMRSSKFLNN